MTAACARFALPQSRLGLTGAMQSERLVFPEMLEPIGRQSRIADRGHDRAVAEIGLDGARVSWPSLASLNPQACRNMWE
jgi:hypothetical protein